LNYVKNDNTFSSAILLSQTKDSKCPLPLEMLEKLENESFRIWLEKLEKNRFFLLGLEKLDFIFTPNNI